MLRVLWKHSNYRSYQKSYRLRLMNGSLEAPSQPLFVKCRGRAGRNGTSYTLWGALPPFGYEAAERFGRNFGRLSFCMSSCAVRSCFHLFYYCYCCCWSSLFYFILSYNILYIYIRYICWAIWVEASRSAEHVLEDRRVCPLRLFADMGATRHTFPVEAGTCWVQAAWGIPLFWIAMDARCANYTFWLFSI